MQRASTWTWPGPAVAGFAAFAAAAALAAAPTAARAEPAATTLPARAETRIAVELDPAARRLRGLVVARLPAPLAAGQRRLYVWLYPNRFARPPAAIDDVNHDWFYPRGESFGSMSIDSVEVAIGDEPPRRAAAPRDEPHADAGRGTLVSIELPRSPAQAEAVELRIAYRVRIPERNGGFGCADGGCTLLGGFYPMLAAIDAAGWDLAAPPLRSDVDVDVALARPGSIVVQGSWSGNGAARARAAAVDAPFATVVTAPRHWQVTRRVGGTELMLLSRRAPPRADDAQRVILPYTLEDHPRLVLDAAARAIALMRALTIPVPDRIVLASAPLRFELASAQPGVVAVSDRLFRIWPARRFRKFHELALARELFAAALAAPGALDADTADAAAAYLTELHTLRRYRRAETADSILRPVSFVPAIDQLIYAPQTMFAGAYFGGGFADDGVRDDVRAFAHTRPRGRFLYEKLRDLLSPQQLKVAMTAVLRQDALLPAAVERALGAPADWFFRQWRRPPRVNYRLAGRSSHRRGDGRYDSSVAVERDVAAGDRAPIEPVELLVVDRADNRHLLRWNGRGRRGELRLVTAEPINRVVIDPRRRLREVTLAGGNDHPRYDNRDPQPLRFVFRNFGVLLNVTDLSGTFVVNFTLGRVHDLHNQIGVALFSSASSRFGGQLRYARRFGSMVNEDQLLSELSLAVTAARLDSDFFGDRAATSLSLSVGASSDSELFRFKPRWAHGVDARLSLGFTRLDATEQPAETLVTVRGTASIDRTITPWSRHTFAGRLLATAVAGEVEVRSQLVAAGGADGIRGYAPGGLFGSALALASVEYRPTFASDLDWNLGQFNFVRGISGAVFADVGALSPCGSYDLASGDAVFASVGAGLAMTYDSFGTIPSLMRLDVAARLASRDRRCLDSALDAGPVVQVYLSFLPPF